ncbi:MAG TPA: hypothetical protein VGR35_20555 [Tepidisphaeraceae bacterium]|nr:hypothetical protein [Tepidisphaeraceae bacterium]
MLPEALTIPQPEERRWRSVVALILGLCGCLVGAASLLWAWPGLWTLLTFTPQGPIRPIGFVAGIAVCVAAGALIGWPLSVACVSLSRRPAAQRLGALGIALSISPALNFALLFFIVFLRRVPLGG